MNGYEQYSWNAATRALKVMEIRSVKFNAKKFRWILFSLVLFIFSGSLSSHFSIFPYDWLCVYIPSNLICKKIHAHGCVYSEYCNSSELLSCYGFRDSHVIFNLLFHCIQHILSKLTDATCVTAKEFWTLLPSFKIFLYAPIWGNLRVFFHFQENLLKLSVVVQLFLYVYRYTFYLSITNWVSTP